MNKNIEEVINKRMKEALPIEKAFDALREAADAYAISCVMNMQTPAQGIAAWFTGMDYINHKFMKAIKGAAGAKKEESNGEV